MENDLDAPYELNEIILTLEEIKERELKCQINLWKALLCLSKEIKELKDKSKESCH